MPQTDYPSTQVTPHEIFLSHSRKQKGFAKDLYRVLSPMYRTFFDIKQHSLPAGEQFPSRIISAAKTCQLSVVVVSEEFMCSKWAMLELCMFIERLPYIKILPLFYQLLPVDLKLEENLERWIDVWKGHAKRAGKYPIVMSQSKHPIDISQWACAVRTLRSINGINYDPSEGLLDYLDKIKSTISNLMFPAIRCDDHRICGKDRLCKVILDKLEHHTNVSKAFVLGLYGPPGSGKSTLSLFLRDHFYSHFKTRVLYLKLPVDFLHDEELVKILKKLLALTDFQNEPVLDRISEPREVVTLLKRFNLPNLSVCLVVDNIHHQSIRAVQTILELGVGPDSIVILVAKSRDDLRLAFGIQGDRYMFDYVNMPGMVETEALELFLQIVGAGMGLDSCAIKRLLTPMHREIALGIVRTCGFGTEDNLLYHPAAVEKIAEDILRHTRGETEHDVCDLKGLLECQVTSRIQDCNLEGVKAFISKRFNALPDGRLQALFLDIALLPKNWRVAEVLCELHKCSPETLETMVEQLERRDFVKATSTGYFVHEVHAQFAKFLAHEVHAHMAKLIVHEVHPQIAKLLVQIAKSLEFPVQISKLHEVHEVHAQITELLEHEVHAQIAELREFLAELPSSLAQWISSLAQLPC